MFLPLRQLLMEMTLKRHKNLPKFFPCLHFCIDQLTTPLNELDELDFVAAAEIARQEDLILAPVVLFHLLE